MFSCYKINRNVHLPQFSGLQMKKKTKGQLEAEICEAVITFEKEFMGRGPLETKAYIIDDMVLVRLKNVLTQAELKLAGVREIKEGRELVKRIRITLLEQGRPLLEAAVENILGIKVKSLHTDISTVTGERVILFTMDSPILADKSNNRKRSDRDSIASIYQVSIDKS